MKIKYLAITIDDILTDGKVYLDGEGRITKAFSIKDAEFIHNSLSRMGITPIVIANAVLEECEAIWCENAGIKEEFIWEVERFGFNNVFLTLTSEDIPIDKVAFLGDDIMDLDAMTKIQERGGTVACSANADEEVKAIANYVCKRSGGEGVVQEFINWAQFQNSPKQKITDSAAGQDKIAQETIKQLEFDMAMITTDSNTGEELSLDSVKAMNEDNYKTYLADKYAIEAIKGLQQYRAAGTVTAPDNTTNNLMSDPDRIAQETIEQLERFMAAILTDFDTGEKHSLNYVKERNETNCSIYLTLHSAIEKIEKLQWSKW